MLISAERSCDTVRVIEVIESKLLARGSGQEDSPCRRVTQYYSLDGELLAERDPVYGDALLSPGSIRRLTCELRACKDRLSALRELAKAGKAEELRKEAEGEAVADAIARAGQILYVAKVETEGRL